jgi:hypothetical protein
VKNIINSILSSLYEDRLISLLDDLSVIEALNGDPVACRIMNKKISIFDGDVIGVRINLNIFKSKGITVQSIHKGSFSNGYKVNKGLFNRPVISYLKVVTLREAYFNVSQHGRRKIALGLESKFPIASVDGKYCSDVEPIFSGIEIRFNPIKGHLFTDLENRPIHYADEVTIYGHRAYARGLVEYFDLELTPTSLE